MLLENKVFLGFFITVLMPYGLLLLVSALRTIGSQLSDYESIVIIDEGTQTRITQDIGGCCIVSFFDTERVESPALKIRAIARGYIIVVPILRFLAFVGPVFFVLSLLIYFAHSGGVLYSGWNPTTFINVLTILALISCILYLFIKTLSRIHEHLILLHPNYAGAPVLPVLLELIPLWKHNKNEK